MAVRLLISETQYKFLNKKLVENKFHETLINQILDDLGTNYEPIMGVSRENSEYIEKPQIKIKTDESIIGVDELYTYLKTKYQLGGEFIKQVVSDWMLGGIKDGRLSKNVAIS